MPNAENGPDHAQDAESPMSIDSVRAYLNKIARVELLTAAQEVALAKRIEVGLFADERLGSVECAQASAAVKRDLRWLVCDGERAKAHLLEANLRLVVSMSKRYIGRGMPLLDLIQEGNLGLIRAMEKFDYTQGYKFSTYATWWIRQAISRGMADQARMIRLPVHLVGIVNKLDRLRRDLIRDLGGEPTIEELAKALDLTPERVAEVRHYAREPVSLDLDIGKEGNGPLGDFIEDTEAVIAFDAAAYALPQDQVREVLATLTEREAGVLRLRFGLTGGRPRTLDEIGQVTASPVNASGRSRPMRCPSCGTRPAATFCAATSTEDRSRLAILCRPKSRRRRSRLPDGMALRSSPRDGLAAIPCAPQTAIRPSAGTAPR